VFTLVTSYEQMACPWSVSSSDQSWSIQWPTPTAETAACHVGLFTSHRGAACLPVSSNVKLYRDVCLPAFFHALRRWRWRFSVTCYAIICFDCSVCQDSHIIYVGQPCLFVFETTSIAVFTKMRRIKKFDNRKFSYRLRSSMAYCRKKQDYHNKISGKRNVFRLCDNQLTQLYILMLSCVPSGGSGAWRILRSVNHLAKANLD